MMPARSRDSRSSSNSDRNSMASNEGGVMHGSPTYLLEHLATFTVSPENDLVYPADGMRRLLAMEKTNGIWTQKMLMRLERKMVIIMDHENKEIVERFPSSLVREPTAFTSNDPKEMYNNILIYIVGHLPDESPTPAEMHIFQCVNVRARDVVEDLKAFMSGGPGRGELSSGGGGRGGGGGGGRGGVRGGAPPRDDHEIKVGDLSPYDDRHRHTETGGRTIHAQLESGGGGGGGGKRQGGGGGGGYYDDNSSTSSDKHEKDVTILNRCFDDIEKFIARLQHAAAAFRELEKRRRSRKSKKKDLGDGMLSMRAKPPPEREFVDIFQKFKLSFNLLAKLKAHIHEPNAPELVHFLFTPLALIVDASHDSHYGPNLPSKVISPLLTSIAVELLINCLTSKESELWHSMGEPWYIPLEEWKGYVSPYKPVFMDGWTPSVSYDGKRRTGGRHPVEEDDSTTINEEEEEEFDPGRDEEGGPSTTTVTTRRQQHQHHHHGYGYGGGGGGGGGGGAAVGAIQTDSENELRRQDRYSDEEESEQGASRFEQQQRAWLHELLSRGIKVVQVTYPRTANNEKELTVVRGEYLEVIDDSRKWWKTRNIHGQVAHVPHTIVTSAIDEAEGSGGTGGGGGVRSPEWIQRERKGRKGEFRYF